MPDFHLQGVLIGACNCQWGCPCNFEAPPSEGECGGIYVWCVERGRLGGVAVDGLTWAHVAHSPGATHLGNLTALYLVDQRASSAQRIALEHFLANDPSAAPFAIFQSLTSNFLGFRYVPFTIRLDGVRSQVHIADAAELILAPMKNPVTGEDEPATLLKPKGFTSKIQELCTTAGFRVRTPGFEFDHTGRYAEFCPFEYPA